MLTAFSIKPQHLHRCKQRKCPMKKVGFIFEKVLDFLSLLWYVARLTGGAFMKDTIAELWHGNICPQAESRNNTPATKKIPRT